MVRKGVPIPGYTTIPEFKLDERSRVYLTTLVQNNVVVSQSLVIIVKDKQVVIEVRENIIEDIFCITGPV